MSDYLFEKKDLYQAYRKVKFELFNDKNSVTTLKLFEYEKKLNININSLFEKIKNGSLKNKKFQCKSYYEMPKSYTNTKGEDKKVHFFSSSLSHHNSYQPTDIKLKFRKVIDAEIDFHIISALWVYKIGQYIDEKFDNNIYGSRLTRIKPINTSSCEIDLSNQKYNIESPKIFESYNHKYQAWRDNSFKAIRELHKTSSVVAITMDITSFYHSIELIEFTKDSFYKQFKLETLFENENLKKFHIDFIELLYDWNKTIDGENGVPIGLSASSILANAIMKDFDDSVIKNLSPTYYGRYVDDILLVFPDNGNLNCGEEIIEYLVKKDIIKINDNNPEELLYKNLIFKKEKQKIFYLDKNADLSIIDAIEAEIYAVSSEWRFLPDIADTKSSLLQKVVGFYADGKEFNDALRKIDATTIKRLGLSLLISHSHSLNQYINPNDWKGQRFKIYDLMENHIFIPQNFFENYTFLPRIFRLMVHSGDGERAYCFLNKLINEVNKLEKSSTKISSNDKVMNFEIFKKYNFKILQEVFLESFNILNKISKRYSQNIIKLLNYDKNILNIHNKLFIKSKDLDFENIHMPIEEISNFTISYINANLFLRDLSFDGFSTSTTQYVLNKDDKLIFSKILIKDLPKVQNILTRNKDCIINKTDIKYLDSIDKFKKSINNNFKKNRISNLPLIFPTRLFSPLDISIICKNENFINIINAIRGTHSAVKEENNIEVETIENKKIKFSDSIDIAITNFKVHEDFWKKSIIEQPIRSLARFRQIEQIVNEAVRKKPTYIVLPELALPQEWAWLISKKLLANNISLITGVEYIHSTKELSGGIFQKVVHNSIMMFLISDDIGFNYSKFFRQDKTIGAYQEIIDLHNKANIKLIADKNYQDKKIYKHGNFYFSSLICNELTDIENRFNLRGNIDCLFVVEWNRDIKSFNSLIEASALDIHSYVVQVNNRAYGDSRIRAPYKEEYLRDIVQVRGGKHDYLIVGEININKLREFQSHNVSPNEIFKPVPTGFKMLKDRERCENN